MTTLSIVVRISAVVGDPTLVATVAALDTWGTLEDSGGIPTSRGPDCYQVGGRQPEHLVHPRTSIGRSSGRGRGPSVHRHHGGRTQAPTRRDDVPVWVPTQELATRPRHRRAVNGPLGDGGSRSRECHWTESVTKDVS